jgi:hypothetical protein
MADEGMHCPAVRQGDWPRGQVMGGRVVCGGGGRAVAVNKIKESSSTETAFNLWEENESFLNIPSSCSTLIFILLDTRPLFSIPRVGRTQKEM